MSATGAQLEETEPAAVVPKEPNGDEDKNGDGKLSSSDDSGESSSDSGEEEAMETENHRNEAESSRNNSDEDAEKA